MVILTWLRQLQEFFYEIDDTDTARDWNKHGRYYGTTKQPTGDYGLGYVHMSTVNTTDSTRITNMSFFKPTEGRTDVVSSLEAWAAKLLVSGVEGLTCNKNQLDKESKKRLKRALKKNNFKQFSVTEKDYKNQSTIQTTSTESPTQEVRVTSFVTSSIGKTNKTIPELFFSICTALRTSMQSM